MTTKCDILKLKALTALGNIEALFVLGCNYFCGVGVDADLVKSHAYLYKASQRGFLPAKNLIQLVFDKKGESSSLNPEFAVQYKAFCKLCCVYPFRLEIYGRAKTHWTL